MQTQRIKLADLAPNKGQIPGLPSNPRQWTRTEIDKIAKSLKETPELFEARPIIVTPYGGKYIILGGNLRYEGCKANKDKDAPCIIIPEGTTVEKMKEIVVKDNGAFGQWDFDALANEWDDLPLVDWGVPAWETEDMKLSTKGREGGEGYDEFVDKFNQEQPLTTDDCYTPPEVYNLVRDFVTKKVSSLEGRKIVRPFFPGGDYEDLKQYPAGCVVLDNPPFSIYSKIVRFYLEHNIDFFLFGPNLTLLVRGAEVCYCIFNVPVVYENGAVVATGFVTNMKKDLRIWVDHELRDAVRLAQKTEPSAPVYEYPAECVSSAVLGKIANGGYLQINANECAYIRDLDGFKEIGKGLFGGGFLISRAAAERARAAAEKARAAAEKARAAAEKERAAAEKARAVKIELSPRELAIVSELDNRTTPGEKAQEN